jgi:cytidine deaminase
MGTAVHLGYRIGSFKAVGVSTDIDDFCSPCGMCRQYLREFLGLETPIFMFNKQGKYIAVELWAGCAAAEGGDEEGAGRGQGKDCVDL